MQGALVGSLHGSPASRQRLTFSYRAFKKEVGEATTGVRAWLWLGAIFGCRLPPGRRKAATRLPQGCHKAKRRPGLQDAAYALFWRADVFISHRCPRKLTSKGTKATFFLTGYAFRYGLRYGCLGPVEMGLFHAVYGVCGRSDSITVFRRATPASAPRGRPRQSRPDPAGGRGALAHPSLSGRRTDRRLAQQRQAGFLLLERQNLRFSCHLLPRLAASEAMPPASVVAHGRPRAAPQLPRCAALRV